MDSRNRDKSPVHRKSDYKHRDRDIHSSRDKDSRDIPTSRDIHRNSHREIDRDSREIEHQHSNEKNIIKEVPNFAKSGSLNKDFLTFNGVLLKYAQPLEARVPEEKGKRLFVFKKDKHLDTIDISKQSAYLMGRDRDVCDLPFDHPSISKQHAVLQYRQISTKTLDGSYKNVIKLYIIDLESTHGTRLDGKRIEVGRYYELRDGDVIKLGESMRELVIMDAGMVEEID